MKKGNLVTAALCAAVSIYIIVVALGYPKAEAYGTGVPGPGMWPICIASLLLVCAIILTVKTLLSASRAKKAEQAGLPVEEEELKLWTADTRRVYLSMAILTVYVLLLKPIGFILCTSVMMLIFVQWFSKKKIIASLLISVVCTLGVYFVFKLVLNVPVNFGLFYL